MTQYVRYVGKAHRRVITAADWRSIRLTGEQHIWESQNGFAIPLDQFTEDQIKKAIGPDKDFVITNEDEDFQPTYGPADMTPWELNQSVENPVDVIALLNGDHQEPVTHEATGGAGVVRKTDEPVDAWSSDSIKGETA